MLDCRESLAPAEVTARLGAAWAWAGCAELPCDPPAAWAAFRFLEVGTFRFAENEEVPGIEGFWFALTDAQPLVPEGARFGAPAVVGDARVEAAAGLGAFALFPLDWTGCSKSISTSSA